MVEKMQENTSVDAEAEPDKCAPAAAALDWHTGATSSPASPTPCPTRVTIRRILLLSFLLVGLVPATVLTVLAFNRTQTAMQAEIEQGVLRSASAVSTDLDKLIYERLLNATTWNHLEVMQDLRLNDVDKRLSGFLGEMKRRYGGVYLDLHATDLQGRVIASSEPGQIGVSLPSSSAPWRQATLPGGIVHLDTPTPMPPPVGQRLRFRAEITSQFTEGRLGELVLDVDGALLDALVDQAAGPSRDVLVMDHEGRLIAASATLRRHGLAARESLPTWADPGSPGGVEQRSGQPLIGSDVIAGHQRSPGVRDFPGFAWNTWILQDADVALAPVTRMAWVFAGLLATTALGTLVLTLAVAGSIARPIVALTEFTRGYLRPGAPATPPPHGPGELGELNRSFVRLVEDLQRSQQTLVQASKLAALGEVTALLAHEVRTPLGILRSSAQMLASEPALSPEGQELINIVQTETARLNRLVSSMLDSARTREPQRQLHDVHTLIAHAVSLLAAQSRDRGIRLRIFPEATHFTANCDAEQITQVLLNLLMNALQILPRGGQVEIRTRNEHERLFIEVGDDGPGIPVEERAHVFEPFVFKREGGVGLGLAVVRQILRSHGGEVSADASPLGGALFRVWIPLQPTPAP